MCDLALKLFLDETLNRGRFAADGDQDGVDVLVDSSSREELLRAAGALCSGGRFADDEARQKFDQIMNRIGAADEQR